jgi:hypothetical protein
VAPVRSRSREGDRPVRLVGDPGGREAATSILAAKLLKRIREAPFGIVTSASTRRRDADRADRPRRVRVDPRLQPARAAHLADGRHLPTSAKARGEPGDPQHGIQVSAVHAREPDAAAVHIYPGGEQARSSTTSRCARSRQVDVHRPGVRRRAHDIGAQVKLDDVPGADGAQSVKALLEATGRSAGSRRT